MNCRICSIATVLVGCAALTAFGMGLASRSEQAAPATATPAPAAKQAQPPSTNGAQVCKVDETHSLALFRVHHLGASQFWGRFNDVDGSFTFTPGTAEGMKFDIAIKTESVDTGADKLDQHLRSPDFFAAKDFPTMTFVSKSAKKTGENTYDLSGDLTIRGTTKPIVAKLEYTGTGEFGMGKKSGFEATFTIKRSEFGVSYMLDKGALGDDVRVVVCLEGNVQK
ncbi:MAG: YceI family protein [Phycisphaerae bacterium]|nr:YceI family protein [Phycisphaerae bacterium]